MKKAVYDEAKTMFRDLQVEMAAVTKNGTVLACIWFSRYGLNEVGIYEIAPSIKPRRIFKHSKNAPRVWQARVYLRKIAKRIGASVITNDDEMQKFLATEKSA